MIICLCNNINSQSVNNVISEKQLKSVKELQKEMSICNDCKCCASTLHEMICANKVLKAA